MTARRARAMTRLTLLVAITAQLADLATFGIAAHVAGPAGEIGPLGALYVAGGFATVAMAKLLGLAAMLCIFALYERLVGSPRRIALAVGAVGVFGAATNVWGILGAASVAGIGALRL